MKENRLVFVVFALLIPFLLAATHKEKNTRTYPKEYSEYRSFSELLTAKNSHFFIPERISPVGTKKNPMYHGFFFYNCSQNELYQFDSTGRYLLALRIFVEGRKVQPHDKGEVGYFDLQKKNKWAKIGETTAWNWQQGTRLQWVPGSDEEIVWNDRSPDGSKLVSRVYNMKTKLTRKLPLPIYTISPNGETALTINFERIVHGGCKYVGINNPYQNQWAPSEIGIWKMDMKSGKVEMLMSVRQMAHVLYPDGLPSDTLNGTLYFFREGFNPSGNRFIAFVKDARQVEPGRTSSRTEGFSMNLNGGDLKYFYREPSHHFWLNDTEIMDNGFHTDPELGELVRGYFRFVDDGTGQAKEKYFDAPNGHITLHKNGEWILTDTYNIDGYIYLYMYHIPSKKLVPLSKLEYKLGGFLFPYNPGIFRVDLHPRFTPDGKKVCIDSSHEGFGRQIYLIDISEILNNPPE